LDVGVSSSFPCISSFGQDPPTHSSLFFFYQCSNLCALLAGFVGGTTSLLETPFCALYEQFLALAFSLSFLCARPFHSHHGCWHFRGWYPANLGLFSFGRVFFLSPPSPTRAASMFRQFFFSDDLSDFFMFYFVFFLGEDHLRSACILAFWDNDVSRSSLTHLELLFMNSLLPPCYVLVIWGYVCVEQVFGLRRLQIFIDFSQKDSCYNTNLDSPFSGMLCLRVLLWTPLMSQNPLNPLRLAVDLVLS